MVDFDPKFTEVVFFDIEAYVPPEGRRNSRSSMIFNPAEPEHFILGGVFRRSFPLQKRLEPPWEIWNWKKEGEKDTLRQIYEYFRESWKMIEGKNERNPDLILVGSGISRLDIPSLFVKSVMYRIDTEVVLYETYFKSKIVDLGDVGIGLFRPNPQIYAIYPKTINALVSRLRLPNRKESGKSVWDLYDSNDFEGIKRRTASEVDDIVEIARRISSGTF